MSKDKRKALGRGLGALIPTQEPAAQAELEVSPAAIAPNPWQPRREFDDSAIEELANSIREHGIIQPLIVTRSGDGYQLIAGERRLRAAKKAGLEKVPVVVRESMPNETTLALALIENIQREDLNPMEEAHAYEQLHEEFGLTQEEISKRVGKERSTVANALRLLRLPEGVQSMVAGGQLGMGHARALLGLDDRERQLRLARRAVSEGLSVRQVEAAVAEAPEEKRKGKKEKPKDVFTRDAEEKLMQSLRTRVEIDRKRRGGTIRVQFSSEEELIRLFDELSRNGRKR